MDLSHFPTLIPLRWAAAPWIARSLSLLIVAWWTMEAYYWSNFPRGAVYRDRFSNPLIVLSIFVNLGLCLGLTAHGYGVIKSPPMWLPALGLALACTGLVLRFLSIRTLGRHYTSSVTLLPEHELITTGMFGTIRHPAYLGALLLGFGLSLALVNWWACLFYCATHVPVMLYRVHVEELALSEHFGERYLAYRARTRALLPYVY